MFNDFFGTDDPVGAMGVSMHRNPSHPVEKKRKHGTKTKKSKRTVQERASDVRCQAKTLLDALIPPRDIIQSAEAVRDKLQKAGAKSFPALVRLAEQRLNECLTKTLRLFPTEADAVVAYFNGHPTKRDTPDVKLVESGMVPRLRNSPAARQQLRELIAHNRVFVAQKISAEVVQPTKLLVEYLIRNATPS